MPPLVSVITVTRNPGALLAPTLASVREQVLATGQVETVVVDGASNDGTVAYLQANPEIVDRWTSEPDAGIYDAMNKGVQLASGEWILFLNAGDHLVGPDALQALGLSPQPDGSEVVCGGVEIRWEHEGVAAGTAGAGAVRTLIRPALEPQLLWKRMICSHQSLAVPRKLLVENKFDTTYKIAADHEWLARTYGAGVIVRRVAATISSVEAMGASGRNMNRTLAEKHRLARQSGLVSPLRADLYFLPRRLLWPLRAALVALLPRGLRHGLRRAASPGNRL